MDQDYDAYRDYLLLVDVSLFRHAPLFARGTIYNDGDWPVSSLFGSDIGPTGIGGVLEEVIDNIALVDGAPRFKWYHSTGAHSPWLYREDCTRSPTAVISQEAYRAEIHCVMREYAAFMQMLKDRDLYDNTALIFVSDHGVGSPLPGSENFPEGDLSGRWFEDREFTARWAHRVRPMIMIKPRGQRGELEFSRAQVHQVNLPATVLSLAGVDSPYREPAFAEIPEGENRPRKFMRQFGKARSNSEIDYEQYVVTGPSNDFASYRKIRAVSNKQGSRKR